MSSTTTAMAEQRDQEKFYTVYRGRQSAIFHIAYMRTCKVKAAQLMLQRNGIALKGIDVMDYGFGTGTFFRVCDPSCRIAGVEVDEVNVHDVRRMLSARGHNVQDIAVLDVATWEEHPLLAEGRQYDVILISHVLEHLDEPVHVMKRLSRNLKPNGMLLGLLPVNEIIKDPNHKWVCDRKRVDQWVADAQMQLVDYHEMDHYVYWLLPVLHLKGAIGRAIAQGVSLFLGILQVPFSPGAWFGMGRGLRLIGAKPAQIGFLAKRRS